MVYNYSGRHEEPDLDKIHVDVALSLMEDKSIEWCRWDEDLEELKVMFTNELSVSDESILDSIVSEA